MKKLTLISKGLLGTTCAASILGYGITANAAGLTSVSLELALLIDGSGSISGREFDNQLNALHNIFNDGNFYSDFVQPLKGKEVQDHNNPDQTVVINDPSIAVSIYQFGSQVNTTNGRSTAILEQIVDWTLFDEGNQSGMGGLDPVNVDQVGGFTPIGEMLNSIIDEFSDNAYDGHKTVNISSDGFETNSKNPIGPIRTS